MEAQLLAFSLHSPLLSSILRVIDNDTMTEIPRVFESTVPHFYQPNEKGYTLLAEAWVPGVSSLASMEEVSVEDKRWKVRVVSSSKDRRMVLQDRPGGTTPITMDDGLIVIDDTFLKQEMNYYCLPDREEILFR